MRTITTEYDNIINTKHICYACHYTYEVDIDKHNCCETIHLGPADNGNKPFIKLLDKQLYRDGYNDLQTINLYACPRCMTVQLCEEEIDN